MLLATPQHFHNDRLTFIRNYLSRFTATAVATRSAMTQTLRARVLEKQWKPALRALTSTNPKANLALDVRNPYSACPFVPNAMRLHQQEHVRQQVETWLPALHTERSILSKRLDTPFSQLLTAVTRSLRHEPSANIPFLISLLRAYESNSEHWMAYAYADPSKEYTRNLVCELPGIFNLMILVWTPGKASAVHDHTESHCLMKVRLQKLVATLNRL